MAEGRTLEITGRTLRGVTGSNITCRSFSVPRARISAMTEPRVSVPRTRALQAAADGLRALQTVDPSRGAIRAVVSVYAAESRHLGLPADAAVTLMEDALDAVARLTGVAWGYRVRLIVLTEFVAAYARLATNSAKPS